jgi:hypothetical protein
VLEKSARVLVVALSVLALTIRVVVALNSGIWADEGFFLLVVNIPAWSDMLAFLRLHESHPPLFYALVRVWIAITGNRDTTVLLFPVAIGTLVVPGIYHMGRSFFSERVGLLAAALVTVSPILTEQSAQLRPYGLLPLLALASCYFMIIALERGGLRPWGAYVFSTLLLLYTHNWGWVVVVGQQAGAGIAMSHFNTGRFRFGLRGWGVALVAIGVGYLPWATALLYQVRHAGHGGIPIDGLSSAVELTLFALFTALQTAFPTRYFLSLVSFVAALIAATAAVYAEFKVRRARIPSSESDAGTRPGGSASSEHSRAIVLGSITLCTFVTATILSPVSNLLLPRCLATLMPVGLLLVAYWFNGQILDRNSRGLSAPLAAGVFVLLLTNSIVELYALTVTPRSNAREVAAAITTNVERSDVMILIPEWYAASFNHYFNARIEQIDFPHENRSGLVDFSNVWARTVDPLSLRFLNRITMARREGRRIWLVTSRDYEKSVSVSQLAEAYRYHYPRPVSMVRVREIREIIETQYGAPDTSFMTRGRRPLYDDLRPYLFIPRPSVRSPSG